MHHVLGVSPKDSEMLLIELFVNNFSLSTFMHRQFVFSFGSKGYIRFSGQDLIELSSANQLTLPLTIEWESKAASNKVNTPQMMSPNMTPQQTPNQTPDAKKKITISQPLTIEEEETKGSISALTNSTHKHSEVVLKPPIMMKRPLSTIGLIQSGDLRVVPMIAVDFSLGNLTFEENTCLHSTNPNKPNDYRDLL